MNTKRIAKNALMIALIFVGTYTIKVPVPATGGYIHLGDSMIFLAVLLLEKKDGALCAALGGGLSDLLTGATMWILPTLIIKFVMAWIMGEVLEKGITKHDWIVGAILGGIWQCIGYTIATIPLTSLPVALATAPDYVIQTTGGLIVFVVVAKALSKSSVLSLNGISA